VLSIETLDIAVHFSLFPLAEMMLNEHHCVRFSPFVNPSIFTMFNHGGNHAYGGVGVECHLFADW
jgi:hypothetical protein